MRNGYKIVVYLDDNPNSPTYMQTYEVREYDESTCPIGDENLELLVDQCEIVLTGYTGYRIRIYQNILTSEIINERTLDDECEETNSEPVWRQDSEPSCEVNEHGLNTGYMFVIETDINPNSQTYGETRTRRWKDPQCGANYCARWEEMSRTCHIAVENCVATLDGTADVVEMDVNSLSPTYEQTRTINVKDDNCDNCTNTTFSWVDVGDVCGDDDFLCENGITEDDGISSNNNE